MMSSTFGVKLQNNWGAATSQIAPFKMHKLQLLGGTADVYIFPLPASPTPFPVSEVNLPISV